MRPAGPCSARRRAGQCPWRRRPYRVFYGDTTTETGGRHAHLRADHPAGTRPGRGRRRPRPGPGQVAALARTDAGRAEAGDARRLSSYQGHEAGTASAPWPARPAAPTTPALPGHFPTRAPFRKRGGTMRAPRRGFTLIELLV